MSLTVICEALISALVPESKIKKSFKLLTGIVIIYAVFSFFKSVDIKKADFSFFESGVSESIIAEEERLLEKQKHEIIEEKANKVLSEAGYSNRCKYQEREGRNIILIYGKTYEKDKEKIIKMLKNTFEGEIDFEFAGEEYE